MPLFGKKLKQLQVKRTVRCRWPDAQLAGVLEPLARRLHFRYWLETARLMLLWGLAVTTAVVAALRIWPALSPAVAFTSGGVAMLIMVALRIYMRPDAMTVVRVVDLLELNGSAVTAFRLLETGAVDAWSKTAVEKGIAACAGIGKRAGGIYPLVPRWQSWVGVGMLTVLLVACQLLPNPLGPYWAEAREEREALTVAADKAREALEKVRELEVNREKVLPGEVRKKIDGLPRDIKDSGSRREAADKMERARWQLDEARSVIDSTARRDLNELADAWGGMSAQEWQSLAEALKNGDKEEIEEAARDLTGSLQNAGDDEKKELAAGLFKGAGAVEDSSLRKAIREAAEAALNSGSQAEGGSSGESGSGWQEAGLAQASNAMAGALSGLAESAAAGSALSSASSSLSALARGLAGSGMPGETGLAGSAGNAGGFGNGGGGAPGSSQGGTASSGGSGASGGGDRDGSGSGGGSGSGNSGGQGQNGNGSGSGTGDGGQGSGGSGAGRSGGGLDLVYTPYLPDGSGEETGVAGQIRQGERGQEIGLSESPVALGALRPYSEVYGRYVAEAHDSLSRAPLPPDMENLVWQYFSELNERDNQ